MNSLLRHFATGEDKPLLTDQREIDRLYRWNRISVMASITLGYGFLADHANLKKFWAAGVLLSALMNIAMGWSTLMWVAVVVWTLDGWFQGFGAPAGISDRGYSVSPSLS